MQLGFRVHNHYSCQNWKKLKFVPDRFSKNTQISNSTKIRPVGAELFPADKNDEANSRFAQFCESA